MPPEPVIARWDTWIDAVIFNANNYVRIKNVIEKQDNDLSPSVELSENVQFAYSKNSLAFIKIKFFQLYQLITNLEDIKLILVQSLAIMKNIISELSNKKLKYLNCITK